MLPKVTVVGAGHVGATAAFALATGGIADVVLVDVADGLAQGKALDMMHARSVERFAPTVTGTQDYAVTAGSDVVVITAGRPRTPDMTRSDLLAANARIVRPVVEQAVEASPDAIVVCVTNPLDVMTRLAWTTSGLPAERVLGMGGVLDSARFAYFIARETGAAIAEVDALVIGEHGDRMVPLPRLSTVAGRRLTDMLPPERVAELVKSTVIGGKQVIELLKTGSAFYAPAASVVSMVKAMLSDTRATMPCCVRLSGQYGLEDVFMGVPATLGRAGVVEIPEIALDPAEVAALQAAASRIEEDCATLEALG